MKAFGSTNKKGENYELKVDLNSEYKDKRKETVKKVIANMTIGKDVSPLFPDVVKNMQTEDLELKKLVYLYLINYAKTQPELVILAVNTFVKDTDDRNPLVRALAIRTMGCIRVDKIIDYLLEPLKKALKDSDPYVRKTAAICVAKLFDLNPELAVENGLVSYLQDMLSDSNPMVIANAVASLTEIRDSSVQKDVFTVNNTILAKLLAALNECTEWGQICILNSLGTYRPVDSKEAGEIIERVVPRLQHANASVVLSAIKVLMLYLQLVNNNDLERQVFRKMAPPLVTLLSAKPEIQYVALRNIHLILQRKPEILEQEMRVFFTKYNDPLYVKLEKLEVIIKLCTDENADQVLSELREYTNEIDVDFVRKSIKAIGRCAIKIESASEKCVDVLMELIKNKSHVNYIVQESIIVVKDIFRKYPHRYEGVIPILCKNLEVLDEPESKAALIWIIGEYADRIDNSMELLEFFAENFKDEGSTVQLQTLTAVIKLFLKRPGTGQDLVNNILQLATQSNDNPDIRDRAYVYWRLLSSSPETAKNVVMAEKPPIVLDQNSVSESLLDELLANLASLASVYHKSPALLGQGGSTHDFRFDIKAEQEEAEIMVKVKPSSTGIGDLLDLDFGGDGGIFDSSSSSIPSNGFATKNNYNNSIDDLLGMDMGNMSVSSPDDMFGSVSNDNSSENVLVLDSVDADGLEIYSRFVKRNGNIIMELGITNKSSIPMSDFAIQLNVNSYGLVPSNQLDLSILNPGGKSTYSIGLSVDGSTKQMMDPVNLLQVAVKNNVGVYYYSCFMPDGFF